MNTEYNSSYLESELDKLKKIFDDNPKLQEDLNTLISFIQKQQIIKPGTLFTYRESTHTGDPFLDEILTNHNETETLL